MADGIDNERIIKMKKFKIEFPKEMFSELASRIRSARFPAFRQQNGWQLGTPMDALKDVFSEWSNYYERWKKQEEYLNGFPQFTCEIDGMDIHFFHIRSANPEATPILMAHGWPDSFLRYSKTFPLLKDHHLIVPSIPGFGFGTLPSKGYVNNADTAEIWHRLMTDVLGYHHYIATGGDMGRGVLFYMAANHPEEISGLFLTDVGFASDIVATPDDKLPAEWLEYKKAATEWMRYQGAYINIQGTKPYSLGYGLCDSPAAMAGWLVEKYHDWSDWKRFSMEDLLNNLTLYWMTGCAPSSITAYYGNSNTLPELGEITATVGMARFPHDILPVPKSWIEKHYNLIQFSEMPYGGHFTAMEAPEPFAMTLKSFVSLL